MTNRRESFIEKENKQAFEAIHSGEWAHATDYERGSAWYKLNLSITDNQTFTAEFINGYLEEERNNTVEFKFR